MTYVSNLVKKSLRNYNQISCLKYHFPGIHFENNCIGSYKLLISLFEMTIIISSQKVNIFFPTISSTPSHVSCSYSNPYQSYTNIYFLHTFIPINETRYRPPHHNAAEQTFYYSHLHF